MGAFDPEPQKALATERNDGLGELCPAGAVERIHRRVVQHDLRDALFDAEPH